MAKPTQPLDARLLRVSRPIHTWAGVFLALMILVEGLTGFLLLHADGLKPMLERDVPAWLAPWRSIDAMEGDPPRVLSAAFAGELTLLGSRDGLYALPQGTSVPRPLFATAAWKDVRALLPEQDLVWVGHATGVARCSIALDQCVAMTSAEPMHEVRGIARLGQQIVVSTHDDGLWIARDGEPFTRWLETDTRALREKESEQHEHASLHTLVADGSALWLASHQGVLRVDEQSVLRPEGLAEHKIGSITRDGAGALWAVTEKEKNQPSILFRRSRGALTWERMPWSEGDEKSPPVLAASAEGAPQLFTGQQQHDLAGAAPVRALALQSPTVTRALTLKKLVDDLHTGHAFGLSVRLLYDATALGMLLFVLTGIHLWWTPRRLSRAKKKSREAEKAPRRAKEASLVTVPPHS